MRASTRIRNRSFFIAYQLLRIVLKMDLNREEMEIERKLEEAATAKRIAEIMTKNKDYSGAKAFASVSKIIYPELDRIFQFLCDARSLPLRRGSTGKSNGTGFFAWAARPMMWPSRSSSRGWLLCCTLIRTALLGRRRVQARFRGQGLRVRLDMLSLSFISFLRKSRKNNFW